MRIGFLLEYLNTSTILTKAQAVLRELCGLRFFLLDTDGEIIPLAPSQNRPFNKSSLNDFATSLSKNKPDNTEIRAQLTQINETKESSDFISRDGLTKI